MVTREEYDMMEKQAQKAKDNRQVKFDSSLDYSDLVAELRSGEDGLEYASADALEALMARIAELTAALKPFVKVLEWNCEETAPDDWYLDNEGTLTVGILRAARAALEKKE
jgi:hypothetical protein